MIWRFENLWDGMQWLHSPIIETNSDGFIQSLEQTATSPPSDLKQKIDPTKDIDENVAGWAIPGFQNAHSHAFQFAMAGLTEGLGPQDEADDFWSWRQKMYQFALGLTPHQMEIIATKLYSIMLTKGYTWVAEFHYLHHNMDGKPYENITEMGEALLRAAQKTGIGITLIPIFYNQGGFNMEPLDEQRRFLSKSIDDYLKLQSLTSQKCLGPRQKSGLGIHSIRSIKPKDFTPLIKEAPQDLPWHIHIAEQKKEVSDSLKVLGQRPVEWLLNHTSVDDRWHLIHATHINQKEIKALQSRKAHVVLCPSTEGNLGDGIFPLKQYWQDGGRWSLGSDSHINLNPLEELRWLDYIQRMNETKRNVLCRKKGDNSGTLLFQEALLSGKAAMNLPLMTTPPTPPNPPHQSSIGNTRENTTHSSSPKKTSIRNKYKDRQRPSLQEGDLLDLIVIKPESTLWNQTSTSNLLSTLVYSTSPSDFSGTITSGRWVVRNGQHFLADQSLNDWINYISPLRSL